MTNNYNGHMGFCVAAKQIQCSSVEKKCLLLYYAIRADEKGHFFDSNFNIEAETGVSDSTITRSNQAWSKLGLLTITEPPKDSSHSNSYQLHLTAWKEYAKKFDMDDPAMRLRLEKKIKDRERQREWRANHPKQPRKGVTQKLREALR